MQALVIEVKLKRYFSSVFLGKTKYQRRAAIVYIIKLLADPMTKTACNTYQQ